MDRYIGLDAHAASCTLAIVGPSGRRLREQVVETNGEALIGAIRSIGGQRHLCIEEGELSTWLYELLRPHVARVVVAQAMREVGPKSDSIDAFGWAERLRTNAIHTVVFKAPQRYAALRELGQTYRLLVKDLVRAKNRLKSLYRRRGIAVSGDAIYHEDHRDQWLEQLPRSARVAGQALHAEVAGLTALTQQVRSHLLAEASRHAVVRLLQTAPGVGPLRAAQLVPIIVTPHRFRGPRQFWCYCGLAVVMRTSSDWVQLADRSWTRAQVNATRGLNRNGNPVVKAIFKGAATTIIAQPTGSMALRDKYQSLLDGGTKPNLAKLTIARKIAAIVLRIWRDDTAYDEQTHRERMK
jgi:transposase